MPNTSGVETFAITAPGLEGITAGELFALGIAGKVEEGGVSWTGDLRDVYVANLFSRCATRIVVTVARFRARSFIELERHAKRIDWTRHVVSTTPVRLRVTSRKSRLYHEGAIAERFARIIGDTAAATTNSTQEAPDSEAGENADGDQLLIIRFLRDECVVRIDSSGDLLHRRGYRQAIAKAPLRETIASAILAASGWVPRYPLLDPFCGSGTIPIEAALIARKVPPGLSAVDGSVARAYAFERWPTHDPALWSRTVAEARERMEDRARTRIVGSDRDAGGIEAASGNAERAGVRADVEFVKAALSNAPIPPGPGFLVTNPPYGHRVGDAGPLRNLYAALGQLARDKMRDWTIAMLVSEERLERHADLRWREVLHTRNGGIPVRLVVSDPM